MGVPKKRLTHKRVRDRRSQDHGKVKLTQLAVCAYSGLKVKPHVVCPISGYYKGKKVISKLV